MSKENFNKNTEERKDDGLKMIQNAASVLYMRRNNMTTKKRICPLNSVGVELLDYKNLKLLEQFVSERGKILPSRITGVSAKKQRLLRSAIANARALALLPYESM